MQDKNRVKGLISLVCCVLIVALVAGLVIALVGGLSDTFDEYTGSGDKSTTTIKPGGTTATPPSSDTDAPVAVLSPPTIRLYDGVITWPAVEGANVYYLYHTDANGKLIGDHWASTSTSRRSFDLSTFSLAPGDWRFAVVAGGVGFDNSAISNIVKYVVLNAYSASFRVTNGSGENLIGPILEGTTFSGVVIPNVGYSLPSTIVVTVNGVAANYAYNSETGLISIPNVTGDVVISATCREITYSFLPHYLGCTPQDYVSTVAYGSTASMTFVPNKYYALPSTVTVTMGGETLAASEYTYDSTTGVVTVPNITGDVKIQVTCSETLHAPEISVNGAVVSWSPVSTADSYAIYANGETIYSGLTSTVYDFGGTLSGGSYAITVKSISGSTYSEASNTVTMKVLPAPVVTLSGNVISWPAVSGAETYFVYREDSEGFVYLLRQSSARLLDLSKLNLEAGTHEIFVYAAGTGYVASQYSGTVSYTVTSTFTAPTISNATNASLSSDQAFKFYYPKLSGYSAYSMMSAGTLQLVLNGSVVSDGWYWGAHASYTNCEVFTIDTSACVSGTNSCYLKFIIDGQTYITNTLTFTCGATTYTVSADLTGGTISAPTTLAAGETLSGTLSASSGYTLPSSISVKMGGAVLAEGTDYTYDSANGAFSVSGVSGNIEITAVCAIKTYSVSVTVNNGTKSGFSSTVKHGDELTGTVSAYASCALPTTITVKMGGETLIQNTDYTYSSSTGLISVPNITDDVMITVTCSLRSITASVAVNNGTKTGFYTVTYGSTITGTLTADSGYKLPASITVKMGGRTLTKNTEYTYDSSTGSVSIPHVVGSIEVIVDCVQTAEEHTIKIYGNSNLLVSETYTGEYYYSFTSYYPDVHVSSARVGGVATTDYELFNYGDNEYEIYVFAPATGDVEIYIYI